MPVSLTTIRFFFFLDHSFSVQSSFDSSNERLGIGNHDILLASPEHLFCVNKRGSSLLSIVVCIKVRLINQALVEERVVHQLHNVLHHFCILLEFHEIHFGVENVIEDFRVLGLEKRAWMITERHVEGKP